MKNHSIENMTYQRSKAQTEFTILKTSMRRACTWEISDTEPESDVETFTEGSSTGVCSPPGTLKTSPLDTKVESQHCLPIEDEATTIVQALLTPPFSGPEIKQSQQDLESNHTKVAVRKLESKSKRLEKERMKELRRLDREEKRLEKEHQKARELQERVSRKEMSEALKFLRPDHCMKHMSVCIDAGILEDSGSDKVLEILSSLQCKYCIEPQPVPCSITFRREMPTGWSGRSGLVVSDGEEKEMLVLVEPKDFLKSVYSIRKGPKDASAVPQGFAFDIPDQHPEKIICLIVIGLEPYKRYIKQLRQDADWKRRSDPEFQQCPEYLPTRRLIQEALVVLQLWSHTDVLFLDTWQEFGQHVAAVTKAIAQRPFKKHSENQAFSFCTTEGGWTSGVRIDKDGKGLQQVWKRQIQQFNRVSPSMATAVSVAYPSPCSLLQAYEECTTEKEKLNLLTGLKVKKEHHPAQENDQDSDSQIKEIQDKDNQVMECQDRLVKKKKRRQSTHSLKNQDSQCSERWEKDSQVPYNLGNEQKQDPECLMNVERKALASPVNQVTQTSGTREQEDDQLPDSLGNVESQAPEYCLSRESHAIDGQMKEESRVKEKLETEDCRVPDDHGKEDSRVPGITGNKEDQRRGIFGKEENSDPESPRKEESSSRVSLRKKKRAMADRLKREECYCLNSLDKEDQFSSKNAKGGKLFCAERKESRSLSAPEAPGRERRLGPDLSRRIYTFMFTSNPNLVLDLGS